MRLFLLNLCAGVRVDELAANCFTVFPSSADRAEEIVRALCDTGEVLSGREGHEYLIGLGLVQHVRALRFEDVHVRIVSPSRAPAGQFTNLASLCREISAPQAELMPLS